MVALFRGHQESDTGSGWSFVAFNSLLPACRPIKTLRQAPRESVLTISVPEGWSHSLKVTQPEGRPGIGTPAGRRQAPLGSFSVVVVI